MSEIKVRYWGVRGSIPVPGEETSRYGGNTSCVEVRTDTTRVIVDGGTGLRVLGAELTQPEELYMLFTHLHWDHIQGIPFFHPIYSPNYQIHIYSGHKADVSLEGVLKGQMQAPNFPVELTQLPASMTFNEVPHGTVLELGDFVVRTIRLNHPQDATGLRFEHNGRSFVHLTDHEHTEEFAQPIIDFCKGADVLSIDAMFTPEEYPNFVGWGHCHWMQAVEIAKAAGVKKMILFHHAPAHTDEIMDRIQADVREHFLNTDAAFEGMIVDI